MTGVRVPSFGFNCHDIKQGHGSNDRCSSMAPNSSYTVNWEDLHRGNVEGGGIKVKKGLGPKLNYHTIHLSHRVQKYRKGITSFHH